MVTSITKIAKAIELRDTTDSCAIARTVLEYLKENLPLCIVPVMLDAETGKYSLKEAWQAMIDAILNEH